eukprot:TRINITY_DN1317_c0_g1_i1.p1 TRINITY_DN1317_c0_g1~~TRINITY_DN1317_c0_g1_i1.p1  ORF type:complete len:384 (-),score=124.44 TRINITY_DN1317_c0_g1_i1:60-1181(-)
MAAAQVPAPVAAAAEPAPAPAPAVAVAAAPAAAPATEPVREDMVQNACSFLRHPSVAGTPLARRVAFMKRKGMNNSEIQEALKRTGTDAATGVTPVAAAPAVQPAAYAPPPQQAVMPYGQQPQYGYYPPPPPQPSGPSWGGIALTAACAAGAGIAASYITKNYLIPWYRGWKDAAAPPPPPPPPAEVAAIAAAPKLDPRMEQLSSTMQQNQETMQKTLEGIQQLLQNQSKSSNSEVTALRNELAALKSQITAPTKESSQAAVRTPPQASKFLAQPTIPAWQKQAQQQPTAAESSNSGGFGGAPLPAAYQELLAAASDPSKFPDIKQVDDSPVENASVVQKQKAPEKPWERVKEQAAAPVPQASPAPEEVNPPQ